MSDETVGVPNLDKAHHHAEECAFYGHREWADTIAALIAYVGELEADAGVLRQAVNDLRDENERLIADVDARDAALVNVARLALDPYNTERVVALLRRVWTDAEIMCRIWNADCEPSEDTPAKAATTPATAFCSDSMADDTLAARQDATSAVVPLRTADDVLTLLNGLWGQIAADAYTAAQPSTLARTDAQRRGDTLP